ncbi:MAG TPA: hypothetical protein VKD72_00260, partial [Gemmataceae bacterium]|nr:hypothetical protein [Gemmataceae bacterium]
LVSKYSPDAFRAPIVQGPFDVPDEYGEPLVSDQAIDMAMDRMNLPTRRIRQERQMMPPPGVGMPGSGGGPPKGKQPGS